MGNFKVNKYPIIGYLTDEKREELKSAGKWGAVALLIVGVVTAIFAELFGAELGTALLEGLTSGSVIGLGIFIASYRIRSRKKEEEWNERTSETVPRDGIDDPQHKNDKVERVISNKEKELLNKIKTLEQAKTLEWMDLQRRFEDLFNHMNRQGREELANKYLEQFKTLAQADLDELKTNPNHVQTKEYQRCQVVIRQLIRELPDDDFKSDFSERFEYVSMWRFNQR